MFRIGYKIDVLHLCNFFIVHDCNFFIMYLQILVHLFLLCSRWSNWCTVRESSWRRSSRVLPSGSRTGWAISFTQPSFSMLHAEKQNGPGPPSCFFKLALKWSGSLHASAGDETLCCTCTMYMWEHEWCACAVHWRPLPNKLTLYLQVDIESMRQLRATQGITGNDISSTLILFMLKYMYVCVYHSRLSYCHHSIEPWPLPAQHFVEYPRGHERWVHIITE